MTIASSRYLLRPMTIADIPRVSEIERESFPTIWPQTAYKRELQRNNVAHYLVVCESPVEGPSDAGPSQAEARRHAADVDRRSSENKKGLRGLFRRLASALHEPAKLDNDEPSAAVGGRVLGFVGVWFMVDEAHIVSIAVAEAERRQGLGETLLIAAIELAQRREQEVVTLECRVGNLPAQALYEKYGFRQVGVRKRYYTDNNEDALIMTTFPIQEAEFQSQFEQLRTSHVARHGRPLVTYAEP